MPLTDRLSRREREIMDIVYELGEASAKEIEARLGNAPSYSAIRATLKNLESKQVLSHKERDLKYIYFPIIDHKEARQSAMQRLVKTFFEGSTSQAVSTMLSTSIDEVSAEELDSLQELIEQARKKADTEKK